MKKTNKKKHSFEYYIFNRKKITKIGIRIHFIWPESDPDPLFPEVDP